MGLLVLLVFAIPIEHKYDKLFRFFSLTLIPEGLVLPAWYEKKIYFYPSDVIASFLFVILLWQRGRRLLIDKGAWLLWILFGLAFLSLGTSSLATYPTPYLRLWQFSTGISLFSLIAYAAEKRTFLHAILWALWIAALFQALLAIGQYFHQGSLGLRLLGEPTFSPLHPKSPSFCCPGGSLWLFDIAPNAAPSLVVRSTGTFAHPNVLGGFLMIALLTSYFLLSLSQRMSRAVAGSIPLFVFALGTTYSRSALFGWLFFSLVWLIWICFQHRSHAQRVLWLFTGSLALSGLLLGYQYVARGGVFGSNPSVASSNMERLSFLAMAWKMIQDHPWFGVGYNHFGYASMQYVSPSSWMLGGVHNIYLLLASEMGIPALIAFLTFLFLLMKRTLTSVLTPLSITLIVLLGSLLWVGCVDFYPLLFQPGRLLLFLIAGLLASQQFLTQQPPLEKRAISNAFDRISARYDLLNRILSLGNDMRWRKQMARYLPQQPFTLLDVATGTADQLIALFDTRLANSIQSATGIDLSEKMLSIAQHKLQAKPYRDRTHLCKGDAQALPFPEHSFDVCTISFGIRNVPHPEQALSEMYRVLKPKGHCLILEFSLPYRPLRPFYLLYLRFILPLLGGWISGYPEAYRYLNRTIEEFPAGSAFAALMLRNPFHSVTWHSMQWGAVTLYVGRKA